MQVFPFSAIVGQERMRRALVLNAISPQIGGVLIRGERGTAKSTAARALAALLPSIRTVADCPFNCDPDRREFMCDTCLSRVAAGEDLPVEIKQTRFVDLPVSATEDRVVGTLDLERAIKQGERHFDPGVLATANRGLLYVDEVNLLDDHVVDLLLDSAAMGVNVVEREGISFSHPARFILVGTMNPEEGDLRPQLLDRFALCVDIQGILDADARVEILRRRIGFDQDYAAFCDVWCDEENRLTERIIKAQALLPSVTYRESDLYYIARLTSEMDVDGHRADLVILKTALAHAAYEGRTRIRETDILLAAELALPHRLRRTPFEDTASKMDKLAQRIEQARQESEKQQAEEEQAEGKKKLNPA